MCPNKAYSPISHIWASTDGGLDAGSRPLRQCQRLDGTAQGVVCGAHKVLYAEHVRQRRTWMSSQNIPLILLNEKVGE